ncbi:MAG: carboxylating nicotinate-nucleotide diphosphorylase [Candidatus Zixiibacteriota bacterium]
MDKEHYGAVCRLVKAALDEDVGRGDLTSLACLEPGPIKAKITAKSDGILSGIEPALIAFDIVDSANVIRPLKKDAEHFSRGDIVMEIDGFNQTVLTAERTALNFMAHLSGIASFTNQFVEKIKGSSCRILDTRKTTPGWRYLEKMAVVHGGGCNHRFGLYDMVLIKDNHISSAGSIKSAVEKTMGYLDTPEFRLQFEMKAEEVGIEVEVTNESQVEEAISAGVTRLLLDNQTPQTLAVLVKLARSLNPKVELEASGNVNLDTVADMAASGVDFISVGSITHSARASDFSMTVID